MDEEKITYLKEKQLEKKAISNFERNLEFAQDPIAQKFCVFKQTKKDITIKDLF